MRTFVPAFFALVGTLLWLPNSSVHAASHRTENFVVTASTKALATEIATWAERYRSELAVEWLGQELPRWSEPCPIQAKVNPKLGAGGATSFVFESTARRFGRPSGDGLFQSQPAGRPFGWEMSLRGSRERILDSVLPHEITHTIFATHFGRPLPRWADEGACTTVEHPIEKQKQHRMLHEFLTTDRGIAFNRMFAMTEYPADILPLYSQGFSLARFLIAQGGKRKFVQYIGDGLDSNDWTAATDRHYGFTSLSDLQVTWLDWVRSGSPEIPARPVSQNAPPQLVAERGAPRKANEQPVSASPRTSMIGEVSTEGWYASHRGKSDNSKLTGANLAVGPMPDLVRKTSRPDRDSTRREVMLEWGNPAPFLTPTLTGPNQAVRQSGVGAQLHRVP